MTAKTFRVYYCDETGCVQTVTGALPEGWAGAANTRTHRCPEHFLVKCEGCDRKMRPFRSNAADYPTATKMHSVNPPQCVTCHRGRKSLQDVPEQHAKFIRRLVEDRLDDPDDRLLVLDQLGLLGSDKD